MAYTAYSFKQRFQEFSETPDEVVDSALAEATRGCNAEVLGDRFDDAVGWKAAHILSVSPFGQQARLQSKEGESTYLAEWKRLARIRGCGPWIAGVKPT